MILMDVNSRSRHSHQRFTGQSQDSATAELDQACSSKNVNHVVVPMPEEFNPGPFDVICAKGKLALSHCGNKRFREIVLASLPRYCEASTKTEKSLVVHGILRSVRKQFPGGCTGGGFVKFRNGRWYDVGDNYAREKIGQSLRDLLHTKYKSSTKAKKRRRASLASNASNDEGSSDLTSISHQASNKQIVRVSESCCQPQLMAESGSSHDDRQADDVVVVKRDGGGGAEFSARYYYVAKDQETSPDDTEPPGAAFRLQAAPMEEHHYQQRIKQVSSSWPTSPQPTHPRQTTARGGGGPEWKQHFMHPKAIHDLREQKRRLGVCESQLPFLPPNLPFEPLVEQAASQEEDIQQAVVSNSFRLSLLGSNTVGDISFADKPQPTGTCHDQHGRIVLQHPGRMRRSDLAQPNKIPTKFSDTGLVRRFNSSSEAMDNDLIRLFDFMADALLSDDDDDEEEMQNEDDFDYHGEQGTTKRSSTRHHSAEAPWCILDGGDDYGDGFAGLPFHADAHLAMSVDTGPPVAGGLRAGCFFPSYEDESSLYDQVDSSSTTNVLVHQRSAGGMNGVLNLGSGNDVRMPEMRQRDT